MTANATDIDYEASKRVGALVQSVRSAGLTEAADVFDNVYWGWLRTIAAYVNAHPYVARPEGGMTPISALSVTDYTIKHWGPLIPGTPSINDQAVLDEAAADDAWHRMEEMRMRRAAGDHL